MDLVERIEKRRFVGRELLLWMWMESELFEATLPTRRHGDVGLWLEKVLVLSAGRERTRIQGEAPAGRREAKESLHRGKLPEVAGLRLAWGDQEASFSFRAETLGLSGLKLPTVLGKAEAPPASLAPPRPPPRRRRTSREEDERVESDEAHESFYERMRLAREVEEILESIYEDFLVLRLSASWEALVVPALRLWMSPGGEVDAALYARARAAALADSARTDRGARARPTRRG